MRETNTGQAVVLGGSMAGLLAARVLSERFKRVVVIERDPLPPILKGHVRAMVQRLPGVRFRQESSINGLTVTADKRVVTGVQVHGPDGLSSHIAGSLVVDATGRGSRTPAWLTELGYQRPACSTRSPAWSTAHGE